MSHQSVYLKLTALPSSGTEEVEGESTVHQMGDVDTSKMIECVDFTQEMTAGYDARAARGASPPALGPVRIKKEIDSASPVLARMLTRTEDCKAEFYFFRQTSSGQGAENYYKIVLDRARIVRIQSSTEERDGRQFPAELIELAYAHIEWDHPIGRKTHAWDWQQQGTS